MAKRTVEISDQLWKRCKKAAALHKFTVDEALEAAVDAWVEAHCPIPGCRKLEPFMSRGGWDTHVGAPRQHPDWHPGVKDRDKRKRLFKQEYPGWSTGARAPR